MREELALIGFGEAGETFARAADWRGRARAYDIEPSRVAAMSACGVVAAPTAASALDNVTLVLSLVTADQALSAVRECATSLSPGALWCDFNSVSPDTKREAARAVSVTGARYVDVAVLSPVEPAKLKTPLLISGEFALAAEDMLRAAGFCNIRVVGGDIGRASTIKMVRSVMVKGIEALTDEMMAAADAAGVADEVLASLDRSEQAMPWKARAAYNIERMTTHGGRRAAEMVEAAKTLLALGVEPVMTNGTVERQRAAQLRARLSEQRS